MTVIIFSSSIFGQSHSERGQRHFSKRFEELEKIKLLETLDLDEDVAIKFFTRRNKSKKIIEKIVQEHEVLMALIEEKLKNGEKKEDYSSLIKQSLEFETKMINQKSNFIHSLKDILTEEQILKVILFEQKFRKDVRDLLIEKGRKKFKRDGSKK